MLSDRSRTKRRPQSKLPTGLFGARRGTELLPKCVGAGDVRADRKERQTCPSDGYRSWLLL
jgi:hypothetical protein